MAIISSFLVAATRIIKTKKVEILAYVIKGVNLSGCVHRQVDIIGNIKKGS